MSLKKRCLNCNAVTNSRKQDICPACEEKLERILGSSHTNMFGVVSSR